MTTIITTQDSAREAMVASQLRPSAVTDPRVVTAMATVPREHYVGAANVETAYRDRPLPLGGGRLQNAPLPTGRLIVQADVTASDRVLLIGATGGYTAALLSSLAAEVVAVESDAALAQSARTALAGMTNVTVVEGALTAGAPDHAPFDVLIIDGAIEVLPGALLEQVRTGGRVTCGLVDGGVVRLASGVKSAGFALVPFADIDCVALPGFDRKRSFQFPG